MHFFPFLLKWRHSYFILAKHTHNSQSSEGTASQKHCFKFPAHTEETKVLEVGEEPTSTVIVTYQPEQFCLIEYGDTSKLLEP